MTLLAAALLGIVQGVTEFLPVSSTAHLLLVGEAIGYQDPGGVFTVMIQLGSILAVLWVYRLKIINVVTGLRSRPEARRFAAAVIVATIPALVAGAFFADFVKRILYESPRVWAVAFIVGGIVMLLLERRLAAPVVLRADDTPLPRAFAVGVCQTPGAGARRVALGRHHHRWHCCRVEPNGGRGVLVLCRDSHDVGGICARSRRGGGTPVR